MVGAKTDYHDANDCTYISWDGNCEAGSLETSYDYVRERLEIYQKFSEQHPDFYKPKVFALELPFRVAKHEHMYTWFIPFSMKFKICVLFFAEGKEGIDKDSLLNINQLRRIGVAIKVRH
ncbi:hypothetical protein [Aeromonas rivipollensis]|uniref:Uncharacterized protein n=1 Tax=Aeromonas rivipollensis TaxID=948519 RepID=A0AAW9Y7P9_9GAMM|nr:hypothetical protein [Aeromonas rivipollensis]NEX73600.1 hypothetical protein [Aeromonas rivipollensis]